MLGMKAVRFGEDRRALAFGEQKINLHLAGQEIDLKAAYPTPGSGISASPRMPLLERSATGFAAAMSRSRRARSSASARAGRSPPSTSAIPTGV
jgi:hypothetical protein